MAERFGIGRMVSNTSELLLQGKLPAKVLRKGRDREELTIVTTKLSDACSIDNSGAGNMPAPVFKFQLEMR
jgi:hypothetical protein